MAQSGQSSEFEFVTRHSVLDYDEYWFDIDEYRRGNEQFLLAHIWIDQFSPTILKRILKEWRVFRKCVTAPLYALCDDGDEHKWAHFVSTLGFKPTGISLPCNNGAVRQLFISTVTDERQTDCNNFVLVDPLGAPSVGVDLGVRQREDGLRNSVGRGSTE